MCTGHECGGQAVSRRSLLTSATAAVVGTVVGAEAAEPPLSLATLDPAVACERVTLPSGADQIEGFLARPRGAGPYPGVVIIPGDPGLSEFVRNTAAGLAQHGLVGLAVNLWSRHPEIRTAGPQPFPAAVVRRMIEITRAERSDALDLQDVQAGAEFLQARPFIRPRRVGVMGWCGGGRTAILFAATSRDVGGVVPYYGTLTPLPPVDFPQHQLDPIGLAPRIHAPLQGHYANEDTITPAERQQFERALRAQGTVVEIHTYDAPHGFADFERPMYREAAATRAWSRTVAFFQQQLKEAR
jgi:carboxymethylenebutenolidase